MHAGGVVKHDYKSCHVTCVNEAFVATKFRRSQSGRRLKRRYRRAHTPLECSEAVNMKRDLNEVQMKVAEHTLAKMSTGYFFAGWGGFS